MKMVKSILVAAALSLLLGAVVWTAATALQAGHVIDIDVGDEHGHGPDRGAEWDHGVSRTITRWSILTGLAAWPLLFALLLKVGRAGRLPGAATVFFLAALLSGCAAKRTDSTPGGVSPQGPTVPKDRAFRKLLESVIARQPKQYPRREPDEFHIVACADQLVPKGATMAEVRELLGEPRDVVVAVWNYDWNEAGAHSTVWFRRSGVCYMGDNIDQEAYPRLRRVEDRIRMTMTQDQVRQVLGEPSHVDSSERWECRYSGDPMADAHIRFKEGKVVEVGSGWAPHCSM